MFKTILFIPALLLLLASHPVQAADQSAGDGTIGTLVEAEGTVTVTPQGKAAIKGARQTRIHMHDVIATGPKSKVLVLFIDETQISLSENAKLTVNQYVFDPDNNKYNKGEYSVLDGSFKYVSGLLAKKKDPDVTINTSYGNIGIRGTVLQSGRVNGVYGVKVDEGRVRFKNDAGFVDVDQGKGTLVKSRSEKPSAAAPMPKEFEQAFQLITAFAIGQSGIDGLIGGALPGMRNQRGLFKLFQQKNGMLPNILNNMPGGVPGGFPIPGMVPQEDNNNQQNRKEKRKQQKLQLPGGFPGMPF